MPFPFRVGTTVNAETLIQQGFEPLEEKVSPTDTWKLTVTTPTGHEACVEIEVTDWVITWWQFW